MSPYEFRKRKIDKNSVDIKLCVHESDALQLMNGECDPVSPEAFDAFVQVPLYYKSPITGVAYIKPIWIVEHYVDEKTDG